MPYLYLARWEWVTEGDMSFWQAPRADICRGLLDLRSLPQCGTPVTPEGFGLFALTERDDSIGYYLGDDLQRTVSNQAKRRLAQVLGLGEAIVADTPLSILRELLVFHADPTGQLRWKPLRGTLRRGVRLWLANREIWTEGLGSVGLANTVAVFRDGYRNNKANGMPLEALRRWTGSTMLDLFGQMSDELAAKILPPENAGDGWSNPATTRGDTFVEASADTPLESHTATGPNGGFGWTALEGSWLVQYLTSDAIIDTASGQHTFRADGVLSSSAHYAQVTLKNNVLRPAGVIIRRGNTALTYIHGDVNRLAGPANDVWRTFQRVAGIFTSIGIDTTQESSAGDIIKMDADSSDLVTRYRNGVAQDSVTNTTGQTNLYTGIDGYRTDAGQPQPIIANFEAGDLAAAASPYYYSIWRRMQMQS